MSASIHRKGCDFRPYSIQFQSCDPIDCDVKVGFFDMVSGSGMQLSEPQTPSTPNHWQVASTESVKSVLRAGVDGKPGEGGGKTQVSLGV